MPDQANPSPKRKARAGAIIAGIILLIVVTIFVGLNFEHATEMEEDQQSAPVQTN